MGNNKNSAFWPRIESIDDADTAVKMAGAQYILISVFSAILGLLVYRDPWILLEPFIFGVLSWVLLKYRFLSLAIILALWCFANLFTRNYSNLVSLILPIALIGISCNSLRGAYFIYKYQRQKKSD